jgi:hypothetical protein
VKGIRKCVLPAIAAGRLMETPVDILDFKLISSKKISIIQSIKSYIKSFWVYKNFPNVTIRIPKVGFFGDKKYAEVCKSQPVGASWNACRHLGFQVHSAKRNT